MNEVNAPEDDGTPNGETPRWGTPGAPPILAGDTDEWVVSVGGTTGEGGPMLVADTGMAG